MRRSVELQIITEALRRLIPGATPAFLSVEMKETLPGTGARTHTWTGSVEAVAERVVTALYGRPAPSSTSPLAQAGTALESAPWYPARPGDLVHIAYEQAGDCPPFGETYVIKAADSGLLDMQLLDHNCPGSEDEARGMVGCFANTSDQPLYEAWLEAGPHRLTIVRDGRPVHVGGAS